MELKDDSLHSLLFKEETEFVVLKFRMYYPSVGPTCHNQIM